jgi:hypothetical protein
MGLLQQRDTAMLHRLLHDIEKTYQNKVCHIFYLCMCCFWAGVPPIWMFFLVGAAQYVSRLKWG